MAGLKQRQAWAASFARQAVSALSAREALVSASLPECQTLHSLQMAAEKVCKAYLYAAGEDVGFTHAVIRKHFPVIVRDLLPDISKSARRSAQVKDLARRIELLAPNLDAGGAHPENTEYPWPDLKGDPVSPLDYDFGTLQDEREIAGLVKVIYRASQEYLLLGLAQEES